MNILRSNRVKPVHDLRKPLTLREKLTPWFKRNSGLITIITILLGLVIFVSLGFFVCGVCAVESGAMRNFLINGV